MDNGTLDFLKCWCDWCRVLVLWLSSVLMKINILQNKCSFRHWRCLELDLDPKIAFSGLFVTFQFGVFLLCILNMKPIVCQFGTDDGTCIWLKVIV